MRQQLAFLATLLLTGCGSFDLSSPYPPGQNRILAFPSPSMARTSAPGPVQVTIQVVPHNTVRTFQPVAFTAAYFDQANTPLPELAIARTPLPIPAPAAAGAPVQLALDLLTPAVLAYGRARSDSAIRSINCRVTLHGAPGDGELLTAVPIRLD